MSQTQGRVSINPSPPVYNSGIELRGVGGGGGLRTATAHFKVQVKTSLELTVIWYKPSYISTLSAADHYQRVGTVQTTFWRTQTENFKNIICNKLTENSKKQQFG